LRYLIDQGKQLAAKDELTAALWPISWQEADLLELSYAK